MSNNRYFGAVVLAASLLLPGLALAAEGDIPASLAGTWAENGACKTTSKTITIKGNTLAFGKHKADAMRYDEKDSPSNNDAIHWAEEGNVSNFEYLADKDTLAFNQQGYGMGVKPVIYTRCKAH